MSSNFAASPNYSHASSFGGIQIPTSIAHSASTPSLPKLSSIPERKPKLRASCDACAASKVKCSKDHPICLRCSTNGTACVYGLSRKHGKAGRVRKKTSETGGTASKPSKQRPSPNGKEFGKFRVRPEPLLPDIDEDSTINETIENQNLGGSLGFGAGLGIGVGESVVDLGLDTGSSTTQDPDGRPSFGFMDVDDILFTNATNLQTYPSPTSPEFAQTIKPELTFKDPFAKGESFLRFQTPLPSDFQALKDFIGEEADGVHGFDYAPHDEHNMFGSERSSDDEDAQSPMGTTPSLNSLQSNLTIPDPHCCYTLAYSTLESLHFRNSTPGNPTGSPTGHGTTSDASQTQSLDSVLAACKSAVRNVMQLLSCRCANNPHLAMLYASITSKILSWYQVAAGIQKNSKLPELFPTSNGGLPPTPALSAASSPSFSSSGVSTPRSTSSGAGTFPIKLQPLRIGLFEFDEEDQDALRRQVVLRELRKCSGLVEALANWRATHASDGESAEYLFDVLGAWLKSELFRTMREVEGEKEMG